MLTDKDRMSLRCTAHGGLLPIILRLRICQTLADDLRRMGLHGLHALFPDIRPVGILQLKTASEVRLCQPLKQIFLQPFRVRYFFCWPGLLRRFRLD